MKIFSGSANKQLAKKVADLLGTEVSPIEINVFPDGERRVRILEQVVGEDAVIIQSTNTPVDTNYIETFLIINALKRSGVRLITLVMPYMGYQRQDHIFRDGEAVSLQVMSQLIDSMGVNKFIIFDPHTIKLPEFFKTPVTDLSALKIFAQKIKDSNWLNNDTVLVSPDMGGIRRIKQLSEMLNNMKWIATVKDRELDSGSIAINRFEGEMQITELKRKRAVIVDDIISSGKTIVRAAELLKQNGADEIFVFSTHPIFSDEAPKILEEAEIEKVYVTDSVEIPKEKRFAKLEILTIADMIAKEIKD